ncbi:hypothetical protein R1sor_026849 [Riccia sorocarpa]|uniref:Dynein heavy chain tail domain-containing protein n=1 Tax=Riccia sorocarpa TaxID=122646 RepID=A0ABD3GG87_9MARC
MNNLRQVSLEVVSFRDEYEFWSRVSQDNAESTLRKELAFHVLQEFKPMITQFEKLESMDVEEMMDLAEITQDFLDALWRICLQSEDEKDMVASYSKEGMTYLLSVIGKTFVVSLQKKLAGLEVWLDPFQKVVTCIAGVLSVAKKCEEMNLELTSLTWTNSAEHKWVGDPFKDELMGLFISRLEEVMRIREPIEAKIVMTLREALYSSLIPSLKSAIERPRGGNVSSGQGGPHQVKETKNTLISLRPMLEFTSTRDNSYEFLMDEIRRMEEDLSLHKQEMLQAWEANVLEKLTSLKSNSCGKLMKFDPSDGHVEVTFCDDFVAMIRETRELATLGFPVNAGLLKAVEEVQSFQKQGMLLKQIADFYNEISTLMIPSQKLIMLQDALRFESILKNPCDTLGRPLIWSNISAVQIVKRLVTFDLQNNFEHWREGVREMSTIFDEAERQGLSNLHEWRRHWDAQIQVKVVFRQKNLQYEPTFEEIRANHYREIKKYLSSPMSIKGVSKQSDLFQHLIMDSSTFPAMKELYESTEELLLRLLEEQKKLADIYVLGTVDLGEFINFEVKDDNEWEMNFKGLKSRSKELEKLPSEIRVGCYKLVTEPAKCALDEQLRGLHKLLCDSLEKKAMQNLGILEDFLAEEQNILETNFETVEDLISAQQSITKLLVELIVDTALEYMQISSVPEMLEARHAYDKELNLLRQVTPHPSNTTGGLHDLLSSSSGKPTIAIDSSTWDEFITKLGHHEASSDV